MASPIDDSRLCILVLGDGDFSGSLAILRAYRSHIRKLVATSFVPCRNELVVLYPMAQVFLEELEAAEDDATSTTILFGVDATKVHLDPRLKAYGSFDYIIFQHPHIGHQECSDVTAGDTSVARSSKSHAATTTHPDHDLSATKKRPNYEILASQHSALLAHYLYSSRELLQKTGQEGDNRQSRIHLCLCAGQSKSWHLLRHLRRLGLEHVDRPTFASKPLWPHLVEASPSCTTSSTGNTNTSSMIRPQKDHHGGGGDYWLSRYGYQHQATYPSTTQLTDVVNSHHHFFRPRLEQQQGTHSIRIVGGVPAQDVCPICLQEQCIYSDP